VQVRDAMSHIWHALLDDPKASVTQNFDGEGICITCGTLVQRSTPGVDRWMATVHSWHAVLY
jgi:hypothetical protein